MDQGGDGFQLFGTSVLNKIVKEFRCSDTRSKQVYNLVEQGDASLSYFETDWWLEFAYKVFHFPRAHMPNFNFSICRSVLEALYYLGASKKAFHRLFPKHHVHPGGVSLSNPFFSPRWILILETKIKRR